MLKNQFQYFKILLTVFAFLLVGGTYSQTEKQMQKERDSISIVLESNTEISKDRIQIGILKSRLYELDGALNRLNELKQHKKQLLNSEMPEAFFERRPRSRGSEVSYFDDYEKYLNAISNSSCCKDLKDWKYSNYILIFEEFLEIEYLKKRVKFSKIKYPLLEAAVFYFTNEERRKAGIPMLQFNISLETAARDHAADMTTYSFFDHTSPVQGKTNLSDRVELAGFDWTCIGENIAVSYGIEYEGGRGVYTPDVNNGYFSYEYRGDKILPHTYIGFAQNIVRQWMNSTLHRENILSVDFKYLGIGLSHLKDINFYSMDKFYGVQVFGK